MLILILAAALFQEPPVDPEAAALIALRASSLEECRAQGAPNGETMEACAERRTQAMISTYGSAVRAPRRSNNNLDDDLFSGLDLSSGLELTPAASRPQPAPTPPPSTRCRTEIERNADGTSNSTITVCGNDDALARSVRESLARATP